MRNQYILRRATDITDDFVGYCGEIIVNQTTAEIYIADGKRRSIN